MVLVEPEIILNAPQEYLLAGSVTRWRNGMKRWCWLRNQKVAANRAAGDQ